LNLIITCARNLESETKNEISKILDELGDQEPEILNVGKEIANQDTEGLEHHLSDKTIRQLRKYITFLKSNPKIIKQFHNFKG